MELFNFYSMDECLDRESVTVELKSLKMEGKIEFSIDEDILKIKDIDLDDLEIKDLIKLLDDNDVFYNPDYEDNIEEDFDDYDEFSNEDEY